MTAHTPITNEKLRFSALNRHKVRRQGFGVLLSGLESVDSIFHSYTLMQVNFFCHQGVLIVTAKTSPKNQQQKREGVIYSIQEGKKTLVYGLEDFFVTNLELFNSRSSTFLEWSNCKTKFYKDA